MLNIYCFQTTRNKFRKKGLTANTLKKSLYNFKKQCYVCLNEFKLSELQLEHVIPVEVGGHLWKEENIDLVCSRCHRKKTELDILTINELKRMKILLNKGQSIISLNELADLYHQIFKLFLKGKNAYNTWWTGDNGKDYQQVFIEENRE